MMDHDGVTLDVEQDAPVSNPKTIARREVAEAFHVSAQIISQPRDLTSHTPFDCGREFPHVA